MFLMPENDMEIEWTPEMRARLRKVGKGRMSADAWETVESLLNRVDRGQAEIARLTAELYALSQDDGKVERALARSEEENKRLREALRRLISDYVSTLESAHDRIVFLGGQCDSVDKMEASDPALIRAKAVLNSGTRQDDPLAHVRWICPKCTTVNDIDRETCLVTSCGTPRPTANSSAQHE